MNRYEKVAWFSLAVCTVSIITYGVLFSLLMGRLGFGLAAVLAMPSFSLLAFLGFAPQLFKRQDLGQKLSIKRGDVAHLSYQKIVYAIVLFSIFIACIVLLTILFRAPAGNGPIQLLTTQLKFFIPIVLISFLVLAILYLKKQHRFSSTANEIDTWYGFGFSWRGTDMDERDRAIWQAANRAGFVSFWAIYFFGLVGAFIWLFFRGWTTVTIDIPLLPVIALLPFVLILIVVSIATIILYRRGVIDGES